MSGPARPEVRQARPTEWHHIGLLLGEAFMTDPFWSWLAPNPARRDKHMGNLFAQLVRTRVEDGLAHITANDDAAAVWAPPREWKVSTEETARMALPFVRLAGLRSLGGRLRGLKSLESHHPTEEHWYLEIIGVRPAGQGRGAGTALLDEGLARVDEQGAAAYLECSNPDNLGLYNRFGFESFDEVRVAPDAPPMWLMWRKPR